MLSALACGSESREPHDPVAPESDVDSITVSSGLAPTFRWRSSGTAKAIQVVQAGIGDGTQGRWNLFAVDTVNGVDSPVVYGILPKGTRSDFQIAMPLVSGNAYAVIGYFHGGAVSITRFVP
jgi:hypothetical protein